MAKVEIEKLKEKFENGDIPTGQDYVDLIDTLANEEKPNSIQEFSLNTPTLTGFFEDNDIYTFYQLEQHPSFSNAVKLPIPLDAEIISFSAKYRKYSEPQGDFVFIEAEIVKTPQNRYNLEINNAYYNEGSVQKSVASLEVELVEEIPGGTIRKFNWSGSPVTINLDTTSPRRFRLKPKKLELTAGNYKLSQMDLGTTLSMPAAIGNTSGKIRYERNEVTRRELLSLPLKSDTQGYFLDTSTLYADTERLWIHCQYIKQKSIK